MKPYYEQEGIQIYHGDCREILPTLPKVDLVLTDPPYFKVKKDWWDRQWDTRDGFLEWIGELCDEWKRLLNPNGSLYVFASPQMSYGVESEVRKRFNLLSRVTWRKPSPSQSDHYGGSNDGRVSKESLRAFYPNSETILFCEHYGSDETAMGEYLSACEFTKRSVIGDYLRDEFQRAGVTNKQVAALFPSRTGGLTGCVSNWLLGANFPTAEQYEKMRSHLNSLNGDEYLKREYEDLKREYEDLKREYEDLRRPFFASEKRPYTDVWDFPTVMDYPGKHPCEKPLPMMEHIVQTSTREDALVLDCFAGSGVVGEACRNFGRRAILCEVEEKWCKRIANRLRQKVLF